ncbi:MAG TPA: hypothetical protein VD966_00490 [Pyrinomonadaceae bacterium]|nr:hypothetical protein [Pyrinomonadaceae bacterium]
MSCKQFESIVNDLARDQIMEAATRQSALAHAEDCARCAARLADERMLSAGLRALAAREETKEAPARLEAALRTAFREVAVSAQDAPAAMPAPFVARRWFGWPIRSAAAVAATLVLMFGLIASYLQWTAPPEPVLEAHDVGSGQITNSQIPVEPVSQHRASTTAGESKITREDGFRYASNSRRRSSLGRKSIGNSIGQALDKDGLSASNTEIATEFLPLRYGDTLSSLDRGHVVRVELPRTALVSFGLPMNMERANERVKADVVLGEDGLARAIRFVR